MDALESWLTNLRLERYVGVFRDNDIVDLETLALLDDREFERLGVSIGHRKLLLQAIIARAGAPPPIRGENERVVAGSVAPSLFGATGERRQITALFCDLVNSTELSSCMDPELWRDIVLQYEGACARAIRAFSGYLFQRVGDGIVAYFGYPQAQEDASERAIRAGLHIIEAIPRLLLPNGCPLQVRIGISTGLVVIDDLRSNDRSAFGDAMNLAARLQAVAEPGSIAVSKDTRRLTGATFEYRDLGAQTLKGLVQPVHVWRVMGLADIESRYDAAARDDLPRLVGRQNEVKAIADCWESTRRGVGGAFLLLGEAGIGKSRILRAARDRVRSDTASVMHFQCSPFFANTALHPVIEYLERTLPIAADEPRSARLARLEALVSVRYGRPARDAALIASILSLRIEDQSNLRGMNPARQKEETLRALADLVAAIAHEQPSLILFEDLHWADPTTMQLLEQLLEHLCALPLLILMTSRHVFPPKWEAMSYVVSLTITRLDRSESAELALNLAGKPLPPGLLERIVAKTDGVPLYLEEITRAVVESNSLRDAGDRYEHIGSNSAVEIPSTLRDSLMERLDRLSSDKGVVQIASVFGREFSYDMLDAVGIFSSQELSESLERLAHSGFLLRRGKPSDAGSAYAFKHALIQEAAYDSLLKSNRQKLHHKIASVLEERYPQTLEQKPELIAHHYAEAGMHGRASPLWYQAGKNAASRSANVEAIGHLSKALDSLKKTLDQSSQDRAELHIQTLLGNVLMATKGYADPDVGRTFDRARALCDRMDNDARQLGPVMYGLWMYYLVRGELQVARDLSAQLWQQAENGHESSPLLEACRVAGMTAFFSGDFPSARRYLEQGVAIYNPDTHRGHAYQYGTEPGVACLCYLAATLWILGFADQALARLKQGLALAESSQHAFSRSFALFFASMLHQYRRETDEAQRLAAADITLSRDDGFVLWLAMATIVHGWTNVEQGESVKGLAEMNAGLAAYQATGAGLARSYTLSLLAEGYMKAGQSDHAVMVLNESLDACSRTGEAVFQAELYRLKGELALQSAAVYGGAEQCPTTGMRAAEECFLRSLEVSHAQCARAFELRAAMGLCRTWRVMGKSDDARRVLAEVYEKFGEGLKLPDLIEAESLLKEGH
jgi:class 3 adenylate cyclase/predicted ATPase